MAALVAAMAALATRNPAQAQAGARERTIFVSALNGDGAPLDALTPADVVVREDGVQREVLRVSRAVEPMDIALLVDNSAASQTLIVPLREGLSRFITAMTQGGGPQFNIALVSIAARPTLLVDYTTNRQQLLNAANRLFTDSTSGMTLLDGLVEVSRGLERRETPRAVLVPVVTDGIEYTNRYYRDVIAAMTKAGAGLHALTIGTFPINNDEAIRNRAFTLDEGPRATGGQRETLLSVNAVPGALDKLARELSSQFKVVYARPQSLIPPEKTEISSSRAGIRVRGTPARGQNSGA